jgi:hypothetical protein
MKSITQHQLTPLQVKLVKKAIEFLCTDGGALPDEEVSALEDLEEALNEQIFGGEQTVLIQYVEGI